MTTTTSALRRKENALENLKSDEICLKNVITDLYFFNFSVALCSPRFGKHNSAVFRIQRKHKHIGCYDRCTTNTLFIIFFLKKLIIEDVKIVLSSNWFLSFVVLCYLPMKLEDKLGCKATAQSDPVDQTRIISWSFIWEKLSGMLYWIVNW